MSSDPLAYDVQQFAHVLAYTSDPLAYCEAHSLEYPDALAAIERVRSDAAARLNEAEQRHQLWLTRVEAAKPYRDKVEANGWDLGYFDLMVSESSEPDEVYAELERRARIEAAREVVTPAR
jgi:hypothetical protein